MTTAVASPPSFQPLSRNGWQNGTMNYQQDDVTRMLPRKNPQRTPSNSSLSSAGSFTSTLTATATPTAHTNGVPNGDLSWQTRKKPARGLWPSTKAEPVSGLSPARSQSVPAAGSGPSAASAISALQNPAPLLPSQHMVHSQPQQNGARPQQPSESAAVLHLIPINGTFERKTITVPFTPDTLRIGRQTNQKTVPTPLNGYFDSKVLSRQHAEIWAERDGKIWIRDVKSSNGTFVNAKRLSQENRDSEPHLLKEQDVLELGIDIVSEDQKTVVHHKVAARVEHAGIYGPGSAALDLNFGELDQQGMNGHLIQPAGQGIRGRTQSQGSNASNSRFSNAGGVGNNMAVYHAKWLQPVTMEQVVKRLNSELKNARLQSQDLHHTGNFIDAVLSKEQPPPPQQQRITSPSKASDIKSRFATEPPAPPPSQPLPEKPDEALRSKVSEIPMPGKLRRTDTERPKSASTSNSGTSSPTKTNSSHEITTLVEALQKAQKEITNQNDRLKEMEDALSREREARSNAEERAVKLELSDPDSTQSRDVSAKSTSESTVGEMDTSRLQQRLELLQAEMGEMKLQMEKYKQRAEAAELNSEKDRKSLAEMVESIAKREETAKRRRAERKARSHNPGSTDRTADQALHLAADELASDEDEDILDIDAIPTDIDGHIDPTIAKSLMRRRIASSNAESIIATELDLTKLNGRITPENLKELQNSIVAGITQGQRSRRQEQLMQSAPYFSIVGVVIIGVGLMTWLNGWQKPPVVDR